jgi:outer membrane lipoprotein-sorting protein
MKLILYLVVIMTFLCAFLPAALAQNQARNPDQGARDLVQAAFDHYRGKASQATVEMVIHRPSWQRSMTMEAWTKGAAKSLIRITAPAKDEGNGTLKNGRDMWTYNPKVNRVIKLPPSLMSQAWMGSDFSNNDLSKTDSIINEYTHTLTGTQSSDGHKVYVIKSMPNPGAPVVWGMQELKIRDDDVLLSQTFFDESLAPVKQMTASDIRMMGGRMFPAAWKMQEVGKDDQYTLLLYHKLAFSDDLPDRLFTVQELKTLRRR